MRHKFTHAERFGVFSAHDQRCYACGLPLTFREMEVDHLLPETLLDSPDALARALYAFNLPRNFDLNSFANWMPSCGPCNNTKRAQVFEPTPIVQLQLKKARDGAARAARTASGVVNGRRAQRALGDVMKGVEMGQITKADLAELLLLAEAAVEPAPPGMMGFLMMPNLRLAPGFTITQELSGGIVIVTAEDGRSGYTTVAPNPHRSFACPHCDQLGPWQGARCVSCGHLSEGDD